MSVATGSALLSTDEAIEAVVRLLGGAVMPTIFLLHDPQTGEPHLEARLTVDPDVALAALLKADIPPAPVSSP